MSLIKRSFDKNENIEWQMVCWLVVFHGISILMGYLIPNPVYAYYVV